MVKGLLVWVVGLGFSAGHGDDDDDEDDGDGDAVDDDDGACNSGVFVGTHTLPTIAQGL